MDKGLRVRYYEAKTELFGIKQDKIRKYRKKRIEGTI